MRDNIRTATIFNSKQLTHRTNKTRATPSYLSEHYPHRLTSLPTLWSFSFNRFDSKKSPFIVFSPSSFPPLSPKRYICRHLAVWELGSVSPPVVLVIHLTFSSCSFDCKASNCLAKNTPGSWVTYNWSFSIIHNVIPISLQGRRRKTLQECKTALTSRYEAICWFFYYCLFVYSSFCLFVFLYFCLFVFIPLVCNFLYARTH